MKFKILSIALFLFFATEGFKEKTIKPLSPRINHVMLYVSDLDASVDFYTRAFDFEINKKPTHLTFEEEDGTRRTLDVKMAFLKFPDQDFIFEMAEQKLNENDDHFSCLYQHFGIDVEDIDFSFKKALKAGGMKLAPIRTVIADDLTAKLAFLKGPDGEVIELMQVESGEF
jgi:catechol 2,3-dioxygenase-like lactoylglutathione lyase family enzyme